MVSSVTGNVLDLEVKAGTILNFIFGQKIGNVSLDTRRVNKLTDRFIYTSYMHTHTHIYIYGGVVHVCACEREREEIDGKGIGIITLTVDFKPENEVKKEKNMCVHLTKHARAHTRARTRTHTRAHTHL